MLCTFITWIARSMPDCLSFVHIQRASHTSVRSLRCCRCLCLCFCCYCCCFFSTFLAFVRSPCFTVFFYASKTINLSDDNFLRLNLIWKRRKRRIEGERGRERSGAREKKNITDFWTTTVNKFVKCGTKKEMPKLHIVFCCYFGWFGQHNSIRSRVPCLRHRLIKSQWTCTINAKIKSIFTRWPCDSMGDLRTKKRHVTLFVVFTLWNWLFLFALLKFNHWKNFGRFCKIPQRKTNKFWYESHVPFIEFS